MYKTLHLHYDGDNYEVRYCGQVIEGIKCYPEDSMAVEDVKLEQLDAELQDLIIEGVLNNHGL